MKRFRQGLGLTALILLLLYVASPALLRTLAARQLPQGWRLDTLETGFPGLGAIDIHHLRLVGATSAAEMSLSANDVRLEYRGPRIAVGEAQLDLGPRELPPAARSSMLTALSPPLLPPLPALPGLQVQRLQLRFHGAAASTPAIDLTDLTLAPLGNGQTRLQSKISLLPNGIPAGKLDVLAGPDGVSGTLQIGGAGATVTRALAGFEQHTRQRPQTTKLHLEAHLGNSGSEWLDRFASGFSRGLVKRLRGTFEADANFAGNGVQRLQGIALRTDELQLGVDESGLLQRLLPGLVVDAQEPATAKVVGSAEIRPVAAKPPQPGSVPVLAADIDLNYTSGLQRLNLKTEGLRLGNVGPAHWQTAKATGAVGLNWTLTGPIGYRSGPVAVDAGGLESSARLDIAGGRMVSSGTARLEDVSAGALGVAAKSIDLGWRELNLQALSGELDARSSGLGVTRGDLRTPAIDLDLHGRLTGGIEINAQGTVLLDGKPLAPLEITANMSAARYHVEMPGTTLTAATLTRLLRSARMPFPDGLSIPRGVFDIQAKIEAARYMTAAVSVKGRQLGLALQQSKANAGELGISARFSDQAGGREWSLEGPVSFGEVALAGGLALQGLRADVVAQAGMDGEFTMTLKDALARVLGGQLALATLEFSQKGLKDTQARLTGIDLERLLALADIEGLEGSGKVDITAPFGSDDNGVHIRGGTFQSTGPGRLAYKRAGLAASNVGLKALENFQFEKLSGHFDYLADGNFRITARLEGRNPDLYSGHAIIFNLDIDGKLPQLFEALFLSGDFEHAVLKQLRQR